MPQVMHKCRQKHAKVKAGKTVMVHVYGIFTEIEWLSDMAGYQTRAFVRAFNCLLRCCVISIGCCDVQLKED